MTSVHVYGNHVPTLTEGVSRNVDSLVRALRKGGDDVRLAAAYNPLEAMNRRRTLLSGGLRAARLAGAALRDPGVDLVHYHVSLPSLALFSRLARLRGRKPFLVHAWNAFQGPVQGPFLPGQGMHRVANGPEATALGLSGLRDVLVSSHYQASQLEQGRFAGRIHVVPNGVDTTSFAPASRARRDEVRRRFGIDGAPVILYYGHQSPWKGVDVLLQALPKVLQGPCPARALLSVTSYGGDDGHTAFAWQVARAGLASRATVRGPTQVTLLHAAADIAVIPARAAVGTACHPNVLLESMAAGLAVVASDVGSIPEVVQHGRNGLLVPPGDPDALATALRILVEDRDLARRLGQAARATMLERFRWDDVANRVRGVYRTLGAETPHPIPIHHERPLEIPT